MNPKPYRRISNAALVRQQEWNRAFYKAIWKCVEDKDYVTAEDIDEAVATVMNSKLSVENEENKS